MAKEKYIENASAPPPTKYSYNNNWGRKRSYGQEMLLLPLEVSASATAMVKMNNDKFGELYSGIDTIIGGEIDGGVMRRRDI